MFNRLHPIPLPSWAKSTFVVEVFANLVTSWLPIAWPDDEADAYLLFERAAEEYPANCCLRLRNGPTF